MPKIVYYDSTGVDQTVSLTTDPVLIGRASECPIRTADAMVSRKHARIFWEGGYFIEDLGSSNGVYIGDKKVERAPIRPGDTITCGSLVLKLLADAPRPSSMQPALRRPDSGATLEGSKRPPSVEIIRLENELNAERERRELAEEALRSAEQRMRDAETHAREAEIRTNADAAESAEQRREIDRLQSENARMASTHEGAPPARAATPIDSANLTTPGTIDAMTADNMVTLIDLMAELRADLRAALDEAEVLTVPTEAVQVIKNSLRIASDHLEESRELARRLARNIGLG